MTAGAVIKTAFCGPCFGAGDTPNHNGFSIRHTTRNFPNREGSKPGKGQMSAVALMDARSIAATAANGGALTSAEAYADLFDEVPAYHSMKPHTKLAFIMALGKQILMKIFSTGQTSRIGQNFRSWKKISS